MQTRPSVLTLWSKADLSRDCRLALEESAAGPKSGPIAWGSLFWLRATMALVGIEC